MNGFAKVLLLGGLMISLGRMAQAQQSILYTTPSGQVVSNALLPAARAPQPHVDLSDPDYAVPVTIANPLMDPRAMTRPRLLNPNDRDSLEDRDARLRTSSEIMGVPSLRDIFGLPKNNNTNSQNQSQSYQDATTNIVFSDGPKTPGGQSPEETWAKMIFSEQGSAFAAGKLGSSNSIISGFFDTASSDGIYHSKAASDDSVFGHSVFADTISQPSKMDSSISSDFSPQPSDNTPAPAMPAPSAFDSGFSPGFGSQSPFALPRVESPASTLPQLPTVPGFQNYNVFSQPAAPAGAPKPPPWVSPNSPFMEPRKF